jgi:hypothetical protein
VKNIVVDASYDNFVVSVFHLPENAAFQLSFDLSKLDGAVVGRQPDLPGNCRSPERDRVVCDYTMTWAVPNGPFMHLHLPFKLERAPGGSGAGGSITATLLTTAVPVDENQGSVTLTVEVPGKDKVPTHGVDLLLATHDVYQLGADGYTDKPVPPGGVSAVIAGFGNFGDTGAEGVKVTVRLPAHVTFAEAEEGCTYTADNQSVTCDYTDLAVAPVSTDPDPTDDNDGVISTAGAWFPVKVAADAPGPAVLTGGTFTATPLGAAKAGVSALGRTATAHRPKGLKPLAANAFKDADPTDNTAGFAVHVGPRPAGGAGGGTGTELPITGTRAGLFGGLGAAALLLGVGLAVLARRRRVVLVAPNDETPSS